MDIIYICNTLENLFKKHLPRLPGYGKERYIEVFQQDEGIFNRNELTLLSSYEQERGYDFRGLVIGRGEGIPLLTNPVDMAIQGSEVYALFSHLFSCIDVDEDKAMEVAAAMRGVLEFEDITGRTWYKKANGTSEYSFAISYKEGQLRSVRYYSNNYGSPGSETSFYLLQGEEIIQPPDRDIDTLIRQFYFMSDWLDTLDFKNII